jgi:rod shape-determining protein MreC
MAGRAEGLSRFRDSVVLGACVLVSLWAISLDEPRRVEVGTRLAHRLLSPVEWSTHFLADLGRLKAENEMLRGRLTALQLDAREIETQRRRLEALEERAGFYERNRGRLVPASVLELVVSRIPIQAKIRTYGADSLQVWQAVVTEKGLVGRVRQVTAEDEALVELLTEADARISIETEGQGVTGLLRYDGRRFWMDQVPQGDPVREGDRLVTSGLGGTVPGGIPVGEVVHVEPNEVELFQRIEVKPAVAFSAISQVYVITRPGPWYSRPGDAVPPPPEEGS